MKANNIPFKSVTVDLMTGDHLQEEYTKINPLQRVPAIDDNGFILAESAAIYRYLASKYNVPEHWYPRADLKKQARVDEYLNWHHVNTRMNAMMTFRHQFINTIRGKPVKHDEVKRFKAELAKTIKHLDTYYLQDKDFLCGNEISVADLQALCELEQLRGVGDENLYMSNERLKAWAERVKARVQPHFQYANENGVLKLKAVYEQRKDAKL